MGAMIHVNEDIKTRLKLLARGNETEDEVLQRLIRYFEEADLEEIIEARWERLQKEKAEYIPLEEV
jgi:ribose 1,5-bisphosphokinase PhnN